jgi:hypothetical protein
MGRRQKLLMEQTLFQPSGLGRMVGNESFELSLGGHIQGGGEQEGACFRQTGQHKVKALNWKVQGIGKELGRDQCGRREERMKGNNEVTKVGCRS